MLIPKELSYFSSRLGHHQVDIATVSIVITSYNHGAFLAEAIETARAQSHRATEIIVVDDGSSDDTRDIACGYDDVMYLWQEHSGLAAARNTGWRASTGDCIVFLDADDRLRPNALASGLRCLRSNPNSVFAFGGYRTILADGTAVREFSPPRVLTYESLLTGNRIGMNAAVIFRRDALHRIGGFDQTLRSCEDYDVYLRLARAYECCVNDEIVAEYRRHASNMSNDSPLMLKGALRAIRKQGECLQSAKILELSYKRGCRAWKEYYSQLAVTHIGKELHSGHYLGSLRTSVAMLTVAPMTFMRAFAAGALRELRAAGKRAGQ